MSVFLKVGLVPRQRVVWCAGLFALLASASSWVAQAQATQAQAAPVEVRGAWVRPAVPGQSGTGGYMVLRSAQAAALVGVRSPVAASAEVHEMRMDGDVMRMRAIPSLPLPAGQDVALRPGGHHLMLMGLRQALKVGTEVPVTLQLRAADGRLFEQTVQMPVRARAPAAAGDAKASGHEAADRHGHHAHPQSQRSAHPEHPEHAGH